MFNVRRAVSLDSRDKLFTRQLSDSESKFHVIGHRTNNELNHHQLNVRDVLPPILTESRGYVPFASSDTPRVIDSKVDLTGDSVQTLADAVSTDHDLDDGTVQSRVHTVSNRHQFLQTQGYIPGIDSQVTIKHPYVMENGMKPTIQSAFQCTASEKVSSISEKTVTPDEITCYNSSDVLIRIPTETEDMSDSEYDISTFPPVPTDEISRHSQLNKDAEMNSRKTPNAYQDYLQKLQVKKRLLVKPKLSEPKSIKRKNKRLQFTKTRVRETREDLFVDKPETPPTKPPKSDVIKPMKVIQSFRYSRAIAEYYTGQMNSKHSMAFDGDTVSNEETDKVENGWLVKSLGPQVLNLYARTLPSCNPIELRLRRQHARQRALENGRFSKKASTLSNASISRKTSRSHDSFTGQCYASAQPIKSRTDEVRSSSSPPLIQPNKGRFLPDIPEVHTEKDQSYKTVSDSTNTQKTTLVLCLPLLTSDV